MRHDIKLNAGFTLIELVVTLVIVAILGSAAMPMIQLNAKRAKEIELRRSLWIMRDAIDAYKKATVDQLIEKSVDESGYPPSLDVLVEGVEYKDKKQKGTIKFLRKIPLDPMRKKQDAGVDDANNLWGLRSYDSDSDSPKAGEDVFDVYSLSNEVGINGVPYADW